MPVKVVNKRVFSTEADGKKIDLAVIRPSPEVEGKAQLVYGRSFRQAVEAGLLVRARLEKFLREQNLWDDGKDAEYREVLKRVWAGEKKLAQGGGAGLTKARARDLAISLRRDRAALFFLNRDKNSLDLNTAEAFAEQARFDHLAANCVVYADTGKPYFTSVEDYKAKADQSDREAAVLEFAKLFYDVDENREKNLPENKFLAAYNFVDSKLRLIDKNGNLVDTENYRVDDEGRRINENGELIDFDGAPLDEDGNYKVDFTPFLEDDDEETAESISVSVETQTVNPAAAPPTLSLPDSEATEATF